MSCKVPKAGAVCKVCGKPPGFCICRRKARSFQHRVNSDDSKVTILATKQDLEDMLIALEGAVWDGRDVQRRCKELATGMRQLMSEAFPLNEKGQR